jgi:hypothetical protein
VVELCNALSCYELVELRMMNVVLLPSVYDVPLLIDGDAMSGKEDLY